jgi:hypothetical protein
MIPTEEEMIFHRIRAKLHPNHLPGREGEYIARTDSDRTLRDEDVCAAAKTRGNFTGKVNDLLSHIRVYHKEMIYQLLDGFAVSNGLYTIRPNIGGVFGSANEPHDHLKHPIGFHFSASDRLLRLAKLIEVEILGVADSDCYIDTFSDTESDSVNDTYAPGCMFAVHGRKIRVAGGDPSCGVYFVPEDDPSAAVKVERLAENTSTRVTGIAPDTGYSRNRIEIRTQFFGPKGRLLNAPRTISSAFTVRAL